MIANKDLPVLELGDSNKLELGQSVIAIGNALGLFKNTVSLGIVSGLSRAISASPDRGSKSQEMRGLIQTDAAVNVGNSVGPLVDLEGRAIGVNTAIISGAQSIGFAIPVAAARRDLDDLQKYGRIRRPLLGVRYIIADEKLQHKMKLLENYGALVVKEGPHDYAVVPESPAGKAGIQEHDVILELNGKRLDTDHCIQDYLEELNVGDVIELKVARGAKIFSVKIPLTSERRSSTF
jgi:serine protease Do